MDIVNMLWQIGVLASVLVFGLKIGLASGLANLSKKWLAAICAGYAAGVLIISYIASGYAAELTSIVYNYNAFFFMIMAAIMIIAGLFTIREYKVHEKNTSTATCLVVIAPCPCCFGSILATILLAAPTIGISVFSLSEFTAVALVAVIVFAYFASNLIVKVIKKPYPIILGNFMLFLGAYFLLSSLLIPNIAAAMQKTMNSISIASVQSLMWVVVGMVILLIVGLWLNRRSDDLLK